MIKSYRNYDLTDHNTFAVEVSCRLFMEYDSPDDIPAVIKLAEGDRGLLHIGGGSNLLFTSGFYPGTVVHSAIKGIKELSRTSDEVIVEVGAGETMDHFISEMCDRRLWGLENLSGIPGEAGASAVQNVGAYGTEAGERIVTVNAYDSKAREFVSIPAEECRYGYRDSIFKHPENRGRYIINSVVYRLSPVATPRTDYPALREKFPQPPTSPHDVREAVIAIRNSKLPDPTKIPSAGSFFKNPVVSHQKYEEIKRSADSDNVPGYEVAGGVKIPAAWLIDRCGWKGKREGNVGVWHLQPLVIVNPERKGTPEEILALEQKIINSVRDRFGIVLTPEVEHI